MQKSKSDEFSYITLKKIDGRIKFEQEFEKLIPDDDALMKI